MGRRGWQTVPFRIGGKLLHRLPGRECDLSGRLLDVVRLAVEGTQEGSAEMKNRVYGVSNWHFYGGGRVVAER